VKVARFTAGHFFVRQNGDTTIADRRLEMSERQQTEFWEVWYPKATATGMLVTRSLIDPANVVIIHAVPDVITVEVSSRDGKRLAYGRDLERTQESPMCRLTREGDVIRREDIWPTESDYGTVVLLPGGEAGVLQKWWNADDRMEWRWQVEFYNSRR
jgi:hypothetical protein